MTQLAKYISRNTLLRSIAALSILGIAGVTASAQLTLDDFKTGGYSQTLQTAQPPVPVYKALPAGSPLGAARETIFGIKSNPHAQSSTIDIGKGICIVESGFQIPTFLEIVYGVTVSGANAPLGLDLGAYSALQLNFAGGISTSGSLYVLVEVWPQSGGYYTSEVELAPNTNPSSITLPYSSFVAASGAVLSQADASDISYIFIEAGEGGYNTFGITSFQAVN